MDGGSVTLDNGKLTKISGSNLGYMPQEIALISNFTIRDTIYYFARIFGVQTEDIEERLEKMLKFFELPNQNRFVLSCSGGEQRCVSFIISMLHQPKLLILDEPTVGLDPLLRQKMWKLLKETALCLNTAIIITTHYTEEARDADMVIISSGKIF